MYYYALSYQIVIVYLMSLANYRRRAKVKSSPAGEANNGLADRPVLYRRRSSVEEASRRRRSKDEYRAPMLEQPDHMQPLQLPPLLGRIVGDQAGSSDAA